MISDELKRLRKQRHLTQQQLAEALNVSQSTIASWENGTRRPDINLLPLIADFYGVSINDIFQADFPIDEQQAPINDDQERILVQGFHTLSPENQIRAIAYLEGLLASQEN